MMGAISDAAQSEAQPQDPGTERVRQVALAAASGKALPDANPTEQVLGYLFHRLIVSQQEKAAPQSGKESPPDGRPV